MPFDETIYFRIKAAVANWKNTESKKMFGGICYLINGNMFCGVYKNYLILRLGEALATEAMGHIHTKAFDITGKPMKGWVMIDAKGIGSENELNMWLKQAKSFTENLPKK